MPLRIRALSFVNAEPVEKLAGGLRHSSFWFRHFFSPSKETTAKAVSELV